MNNLWSRQSTHRKCKQWAISFFMQCGAHPNPDKWSYSHERQHLIVLITINCLVVVALWQSGDRPSYKLLYDIYSMIKFILDFLAQ